MENIDRILKASSTSLAFSKQQGLEALDTAPIVTVATAALATAQKTICACGQSVSLNTSIQLQTLLNPVKLLLILANILDAGRKPLVKQTLSV